MEAHRKTAIFENASRLGSAFESFFVDFNKETSIFLMNECKTFFSIKNKLLLRIIKEFYKLPEEDQEERKQLFLHILLKVITSDKDASKIKLMNLQQCSSPPLTLNLRGETSTSSRQASSAAPERARQVVVVGRDFHQQEEFKQFLDCVAKFYLYLHECAENQSDVEFFRIYSPSWLHLATGCSCSFCKMAKEILMEETILEIDQQQQQQLDDDDDDDDDDDNEEESSQQESLATESSSSTESSSQDQDQEVLTTNAACAAAAATIEAEIKLVIDYIEVRFSIGLVLITIFNTLLLFGLGFFVFFAAFSKKEEKECFIPTTPPPPNQHAFFNSCHSF